MKKWIIIAIVLLVSVIPIAFSETIWDYLTIGQADTRYCKLGECGGGAAGANISGSGSPGDLAVWTNTTDLGSINCSEGEIVKEVAGSWTCAIDLVGITNSSALLNYTKVVEDNKITLVFRT